MKEMIKKVRERREGFTMAELLIVVAIIAVLVAIAIPVFTSQLEKSRDAADAANVRSAYAEASAAYITATDGTAATYAYNVDIQSTDGNWAQNGTDTFEIAGVDVKMVQNAKSVAVAFASDGSYTITLGSSTVTEGKQ